MSDLIACPQCDALYTVRPVSHRERAVCGRCHHVLIAPRKRAGMIIISLAVAVLILVVGATLFPFLRIEAAGRFNAASVLDTALSFSGGRLAVLAYATAALILLFPAVRTALLLYVIAPMVFDRPPPPRAAPAFRLAEAMKPWAMAEIFALGCAVALIKVGDLASVNFGPAFWMFGALVILVVILDGLVCSWSVWNAITPRT